MRTLPISDFYTRKNPATLCYAVLLVLPGGSKLGFLAGGVPFTYDGVAYSVVDGIDVSNMTEETGLASPSLRLKSMINESLARLSRSDFIANQYEGSDIYIQHFDWQDPSIGPVIVRRCILGRVTLTDTGFDAEVLPTEHLLKNRVGRTFDEFCPWAGDFGAPPCDPSGALKMASTFALTVCAVLSQFRFDCADSHAPPYFRAGVGTWTSGLNNGLRVKCELHMAPSVAAWSSSTAYGTGMYATASGTTYISLQSGNTNNAPASSPLWWSAVPGNPASVSRFKLSVPPPLTIAVGDGISMVRGCDGAIATCKSIANASNPSGTNIENFGGFLGLQPDFIGNLP